MELAPLSDIIVDVRRGRPVLVLDDADRENEADLICAAELISRDVMAMMIRDGSGIVCLCIPKKQADELRLDSKVRATYSKFGTAFTQSIVRNPAWIA